MSYKAVVQFLEATSKDESLQKDLVSVIGVGDGDISTAQELDKEEAEAMLGKRGVFVTALAERNGYSFTLPELNAVVSVFQRYKSGELSEVEFARVMGLDSPADEVAGKIENVGDTVELVYRGVKYTTKKDRTSAHQVLDFMKKTSEDPEFREQLKAILNAGDGDIGDFEALDPDEVEAIRGVRGALVAEFASKHGFVFTLADLLAVTDAFQRVQAGELTGDEFEKFLSLDVKSKDFFPFIQNVVSLTYKGATYSSPIVSRAMDNTLPVIRFMERSGTDPDLRKRLESIIGGDGNVSAPGELDTQEAAAFNGELSNQIVELGAEYGYRFTVSELSAVAGAFQLVNDGKLTAEECNRILGLGKKDQIDTGIKKTAGMIYRGVAY